MAVALVGCSSTPNQSQIGGLTPSSDAPAAKADSPPPQKPSSRTLVAGTPIKIRTETTMSTKTTKTGEAFTATLTEPIVVEGQVVAPRGSQVEGVVADSDPAPNPASGR